MKGVAGKQKGRDKKREAIQREKQRESNPFVFCCWWWCCGWKGRRRRRRCWWVRFRRGRNVWSKTGSCAFLRAHWSCCHGSFAPPSLLPWMEGWGDGCLPRRWGEEAKTQVCVFVSSADAAGVAEWTVSHEPPAPMFWCYKLYLGRMVFLGRKMLNWAPGWCVSSAVTIKLNPLKNRGIEAMLSGFYHNFLLLHILVCF